MKRRSRRVLTLTILKWLGITLIVLIFGGAAAVAGIFAYVAKDLPGPEAFAARRIIESTKIYDRTGTVLLYDIHGEEKRTVIGSEGIPDVIKKATIAVEDDNFYNHIGVEPRAILRAAYANVRNRSISQGASTITQQLVGNTLTNRRDQSLPWLSRLFRKIKDTILAIELEQKYSKEEILAFYLNQIPYGSNAYGVEAAAQTFFAKSAKDLTLAQAATIASLPKAPTYYSPYGSHLEDLTARKNFVLKRMRDLDLVADGEYEAAKNEAIEFNPIRQEIKAPHFVFHVREILEDLYGERYLEEGGLRIITSLDWDLQQKAEALVHEYALKNEKQYKAANAALTAVDPSSGDIVAMVGSRDYFDEAVDGNVNVALRPRQPGSSFKPFAYVTAFEKGFTPDTVLFDLETNFGVEGAEPYMPKNYDGEFRGPVTMRQALARSLNVPAVKTLYLAGVEKTIQTAEAMGITTLGDRSRFGLSLVLGGGEVKLAELTGAYATFAADGIHRTLRPILAIEDVNGVKIREYPIEERRAIPEEAARLITDVLSDNAARTPTFGERSSLFLGENIPVAAKTGTTQESRDAWVEGYSSGIAAGVWVGNNNNSSMTQKGGGISAAGPLWNAFMKEALKLYAAQPFSKPEAAKTGKLMLDGQAGEELLVPIDTLSGKRATDYTPKHLIEMRPYRQVHNILHFVNKDDPRGPIPADPAQDSQYWNWEHPVSQWVIIENTKGAHYNESPPQDYDDLHTAGTQPQVLLRTPYDGEWLYSRTLLLSADATSPRRITRVEFYFDNLFIGSDFTSPYAYTYGLPQRVIGQTHAITAKAYDDIENVGQAVHAITIDPASGVVIEEASPFGYSGEDGGSADNGATGTVLSASSDGATLDLSEVE
ncbi:MAG: transglycosylase domain-containing protein [bacterium]|nr:transglycosylase domain-containing protein [bacterium]